MTIPSALKLNTGARDAASNMEKNGKIVEPNLNNLRDPIQIMSRFSGWC